MNRILLEAVVTAVLLIPVILLYLKGRKGAGGAATPAKGRAPNEGRYGAGTVLKTALIASFFLIPAYFHADQPYSFYSGSQASIKAAFKHTGKRVVDCDEAELIKREGERYREMLKGNKGVSMDITKLTGCPRERHPVVVRVVIDGSEVLSRSYPATGLKKDMSSYISEEFIVGPGEHSIAATLNDSGPSVTPGFTLSENVTLRPYEVMVIRFDDKTNRLVIE